MSSLQDVTPIAVDKERGLIKKEHLQLYHRLSLKCLGGQPEETNATQLDPPIKAQMSAHMRSGYGNAWNASATLDPTSRSDFKSL